MTRAPETPGCPSCGAPAAGNFCAQCGAPLAGASCPSCGGALLAGAKFCAQCGSPVGGGARASGRSRRGDGVHPDPALLRWWIIGVAMIVIIVALAWPILRPGREGAGGGGPGMAGAPGAGPMTGGVDLSSMTPREAADRLFNRVMSAAEAGDTAQLRFFLPMAVQAYQQAQPLDADGYYHLSLLQRQAGQADSALATAREALEAAPDHLLALVAAARAAHELGSNDRAREYYARILSVYDAERARNLPEYEAHARQLPEILEEARAFTGRAP